MSSTPRVSTYKDATLRQLLERLLERLPHPPARPAGHHQLAPEVAPGNLETAVRPAPQSPDPVLTVVSEII